MLEPWRIDADHAVASGTHWQVRIDPTRPDLGMTCHGNSQETRDAFQVFSVRPVSPHSLRPEEVYIRQHDLITRFAQQPTDEFAFQLDWHLVEASDLFSLAIELWVSIQTDLLESAPELEIACTAPTDGSWQARSHRELGGRGEVVAAGPAALVHSDHTTAVWFIEPADQAHTRHTSDLRAARQAVTLFGHFMEKGVIRRARLQFALAAGPVSATQLGEAYQDFASRPLPLTA